MINKIVERITLTKEDIHGMINDAMSKKGSSNPKINFYFGNGEEILNKVFGKFLSNIKYVKDQTYTANLSLIDLEDILESDMQYSTAYNINRGYIMYGKGPKYQMQIFDPPANLEQLLLKPEYYPDNRKSKKVSSTADNNQGPWNSVDSFTKFIKTNYLVPGQSIGDLTNFYRDTVNNLKIKEFIINPPQKELKTGVYPIRGIERELYDIINNDVTISNGEPSELWFAIVYKGKVTGAVGEATPDIEVNNQTVSLKNYSETTFDFGTLDSDTTELLNSFLSLASLLTSQPVNKSLTRTSINSILELLESNEVKQSIREILELEKTTSIPLIKNLATQIKKMINSKNPNDIHNLVVEFCNEVNRLLQRKIGSANWWGLIIKGNATLFLESSDSVYENIKCTDNYRLSPAISNFKGYHLYVHGSQLSTKVTAKKEKS
jgi:hypothetical protein